MLDKLIELYAAVTWGAGFSPGPGVGLQISKREVKINAQAFYQGKDGRGFSYDSFATWRSLGIHLSGYKMWHEDGSLWQSNRIMPMIGKVINKEDSRHSFYLLGGRSSIYSTAYLLFNETRIDEEDRKFSVDLGLGINKDRRNGKSQPYGYITIKWFL